MRLTPCACVLVFLFVCAVPGVGRAQQPKTVAAFDRYLRLTDARVSDEKRDAVHFLRIDSAPESSRTQLAETLRRGDVVVDELETKDHGASIEIPGGLVHHWVGTVFVPDAHVKQAVALLQDYDRHGEIYQPVITRATLLAHSGDDFTFTMRFVIRKVISVVLDTDQQAHFEWLAGDRAVSRIVSTRIAEVENAGSPTEREKPPGQDRGYLWRLASYWRFLERGGGTYIQCESVSLSRPLPSGLGWLLGRAASGVPRDITISNLLATRRSLMR